MNTHTQYQRLTDEIIDKTYKAMNLLLCTKLVPIKILLKKQFFHLFLEKKKHNTVNFVTPNNFTPPNYLPLSNIVTNINTPNPQVASPSMGSVFPNQDLFLNSVNSNQSNVPSCINENAAIQSIFYDTNFVDLFVKKLKDRMRDDEWTLHWIQVRNEVIVFLTFMNKFWGLICDGRKLGLLSGFLHSNFFLSLYYLLCRIKNIII